MNEENILLFRRTSKESTERAMDQAGRPANQRNVLLIGGLFLKLTDVKWINVTSYGLTIHHMDSLEVL